MATLSPHRPHRRRLFRGAAALLALGLVVAAARSPRVRAAWAAFRDPALVRGSDAAPVVDVPAPGPIELPQADLASDFEPLGAGGRLDEATLADAGDGTLATLAIPDLPIPVTRRTMRFVAWFAASDKGRQAFAERFRRAGRYRGVIEQALRDAELPEDLLWLVAIESGFNPQAVSPKGATGLFQFMPETAARYGLAMSDVADERRSIARATRAGTAHLHDLFEHFQQWDLALAAYNFGQDPVDEALARLAERRGPRDAGRPELKDLVEARLVPRETADFVPQIQAFALVAANRGRFGLDDLDPLPPFELGELAVPAGTPLRLVAKAAGVSLSLMRDYNPDLTHDQVPPGGSDAIVSLPADKVATALAAFPALLARETRASASASASAPPAETAAPSATASASASAKPAEPPPDRWTLANGVVVERSVTQAPDVTVRARVDVLEPGRAARPSGRAFEVSPVVVRPGDLASGLERVARAVRALTTDGGDAAVEARRRAGATARRTLEKTAYGSSWLALGERLFPPGSPLAGTVLSAPTLPPVSVAFADLPRRSGLAVTVTLTGAVDRATAGAAAERALGEVLAPGAAIAPHSEQERVTLVEPLPSPRVVFGWLVPDAGDEGAGIRLALLALGHHEHGRLSRALVSEAHVAVHVRATLDLGARASVAAIEAVPAVLHDVAAVERELQRALAAFVAGGPSAAEVETAKGLLRGRLAGEAARAGAGDEPKEAALARLGRVKARAEAMSGEDLRAVVERAFQGGHRVVVVTQPGG